MGGVISFIISLFYKRELNSNECGISFSFCFHLGICRKELRFPITIDCNHTFCYACLNHWQQVYDFLFLYSFRLHHYVLYVLL